MRRSVVLNKIFAAAALTALTGSLAFSIAPAQAAAKRGARANETIQGHRVLVVLPIKTSATWAANTLYTQRFLPQAQRALERTLSSTGRYSVVSVNRFNPVLQRGVADDTFTQEEFTTLLSAPTVDNARPLVSRMTASQAPKLRFSDTPLIAEFVMNRIAATANTVASVEVIGRFYDPLMVEPVMSFTVIGAPQQVAANGNAGIPTSAVINTALASATTAFARIANESLKPAPQLMAPLMPNPKALTPVGGASETSDGGTPEGS